MNLFLNAVSLKGKIILFDDERNVIAQQDMSLLLNESSKLISTVSDFLKDNMVEYKAIQNIVVVHGPWSFTWIRTIVLFVNTLSYIYPHICLTPVSFFDLFDNYPIVKKSSKRDLFVKTKKDDIIQIVSNEDFAKNYVDMQVYGDATDIWLECQTSVDYVSYIQGITLEKHQQIEPLYIKKPNIT